MFTCYIVAKFTRFTFARLKYLIDQRASLYELFVNLFLLETLFHLNEKKIMSHSFTKNRMLNVISITTNLNNCSKYAVKV